MLSMLDRVLLLHSVVRLAPQRPGGRCSERLVNGCSLDARTCSATNSAGCACVFSLKVPGGNPDDIGVAAATGTVYAATITGS
jgi:hypothetical protein